MWYGPSVTAWLLRAGLHGLLGLMPAAEWTFEIPGDPAPWQVYTRQGAPLIGVLNFQAWQEQIRAYLRPQWQRAPLTGAVTIDTTFYRPWPRNAPQRQEGAKIKFEAKHIVMFPDVGNYRKAFLDALQGIIYVNDSQVIGGQEWKKYSRKKGFTVLWVRG